MIIGPRRAALIAAIAAVVLAIIFYPLIVLTPIDVEKVKIDLTALNLVSGGAGDQQLILRMTLTVANQNNMTLTTSKIDYEVFADGESIGNKTLSYEDVPPNGRPALFPGTVVTLSHSFTLEYSDSEAEIFNKIMTNSTQIQWSIKGTAIIESGTTQVTKEFSDEL